ncbi:receptor-like protein EIX1 [Pyrus x bretschneideri]|uniref:receptor-like protein EIX1 n=1 Tax=Pyrus x bretschneideri TaxID=225117 RepID=UPI00051101FC|nr:receptor-like protein EIX1 [Pyrus x bretschneideri]XP_048446527.1 receptor-like protein EIX1 [Pyrus x bretschneideri]XP_048446528.1 receptor-like protein EIX1 [Pyrus x bretschneideri]XP_048446529.1 receptor-like protein EIX1 [Pyrus x bretschneideri]XP_048446530.1 receptor-like protein EIX1 [Pyrus x bretschneideri]XP_048446531.1 receptor-like protein EIX1 [Pyrus x bretschneideri]XP_048446532.1 receptor-like protein EIX1 [Pyrus x bretschneideri]
MERSMRVVLLLIRVLAVTTITFSIGLCNGIPGWPPLCKESERDALLMFKQDLKDPANRLSSWVAEEGSDCCSWTGVVCDHITGHIHELHLNSSHSEWDSDLLSGKINPSLLSLKHLNYLDLSHNDFSTTRIPSFFGSMTSLTHLNLGHSQFYGIIPHKLGNLSSLRYLNLSSNILEVENLQWISGLSMLKHFDLSYVNLGKASDWLQVTNMLPSLVELDMSHCELHQIPPLPTTNFTSLVVLDLSGNSFYSLMPRWVFSLKNLVSLHLSGCGFQGPILSISQNTTSLREFDLSYNSISLDPIPKWLFNQKFLKLSLEANQLTGQLPSNIQNMTCLKVLNLGRNEFNSTIPEWLYSLNNLESLLLSRNALRGELSSSIGNLKSLRHFDLSCNSISGPIPMSLGNLSSLVELDISRNQFNGTFTEVIGKLKMLTDLDISYNSFEGVMSEDSFGNHTKLKYFIAKGNSFTLKTSRDWLPPFQLESLQLDSWHLGPEWPMWLQTQTQLTDLSLSRTGISSTIPTWFWNLTFQLGYLNLSHNQLYGEIQNIIAAPGSVVDLGSNQFTGALPIAPTSLIWLDLSNSSFSGTVFHFFCDRPDEPTFLSVLYLGNNLLTGKLPDCWMSWQSLIVLNLENNYLTGNVSMSMGYLPYLTSLHLRNNHLYGEFPHSLRNCALLSVVDLSGNGFVGSIPIWMGKSLSGLKVLNLRSNEFEGDIPSGICYLESLQILDLAHNKLSGTIPRCFHNLSAMANLSKSFSSTMLRSGAFDEYYSVPENAILVTKGIQMEYTKILKFVKSMDLSCNFLYGEIPEELTDLLALQSLNLSNNCFTGRIPSKIGNMERLESLDFSMNQLDGEIAPSMTNLTFLSHLNLSYNNLMGRIPESTQLQSLDQSSFVGNELCGAPLNKNCSANGVIPPPTAEQDGGGGYSLLEDKWFYVSLGVGFFTGFWIVLGSLLVNMPWSTLLSQLLNMMVLKMYHVIVEYV